MSSDRALAIGALLDLIGVAPIEGDLSCWIGGIKDGLLPALWISIINARLGSGLHLLMEN